MRHPRISFSEGGLEDRGQITFVPLWLLAQRKRRANQPWDDGRVIFICLASPFLGWIAPPPFSMSQMGLTVTRPDHHPCRSAMWTPALALWLSCFRTENIVHIETAFPLVNIQREEWDSLLALWSWVTLNLQLFWWPFCPLHTPDRKRGGEGRWEKEIARREEFGRRRRRRTGRKISPAW